MAKTFGVPIDLAKNEIRNAVLQNLGSAPGSPVNGQVYYLTTGGHDVQTRVNGAWVSLLPSSLLGSANTWTSTNAFNGAITGNNSINLTGTGASSVGGTLSATAHISTGLTGATAASRYVGATASGAPASGTFSTGDFVIAQNGKIWVCTAGGSPGTWADVAGTGAVSSVSGTANQVTVSPTTGAVVVSLPSAITTPGTLNTTGNLSENGNRVWSAGNAPSRSALTAPTADISNGGFKLTNLATPTAGTDAANKSYVDNVVAGLSPKEAVRVATTATGTLATAYENGDTIDGITLATGDRILIKNQSTGAENGIYTVNASGAPTRATDADSSGELEGALVYVREGTVNGGQLWVLATTGTITVGTTSLSFTQFSGATTLSAGAGLTATGNVYAVGSGNGITVNADSIQVDTAVVVRKYAAAFGNGSLTSFTINHALNTQDVTVAVYQNSSTWDEVECDVQHTDANNVTLVFSVAPTTNQYRVVVHG